jgi:hypothetical protein
MNSTVEEDVKNESIAADLGIFAAILIGSLVVIFILIGACILSHVCYMKFFKKP